jgi:hypothetical protein
MSLGSLVTIAAAALILRLVEPVQGGILAVVMLLVAVALSVIGVLAVLGVLVRVYVFRRPGFASDHVRISFRQATLVAILFTIALALSHLKYFAWWNMTIAIAIAAVVEYYFAVSETNRADVGVERSGGRTL